MSNQNHKSLAVRDLFAEINLDDTPIGVIQSFYFDSYLLFHVDQKFLDFSSDIVTEEEIKFIEKTGVSSEDDLDEYLDKNYLSLYEYDKFTFTEDNDINIVDEYLKDDKDVLYIKELKVREEYSISKTLKD